MEKVKVTKEVAEALDLLRRHFNDDRLLYVLSSGKSERQIRKECGGFTADAIIAVKKKMTPIETAKALINGYETGKSAEEELLDYVKRREIARRTSGDLEERFLHIGFIEGVEFALNKLGITIKGVNA